MEAEKMGAMKDTIPNQEPGGWLTASGTRCPRCSIRARTRSMPLKSAQMRRMMDLPPMCTAGHGAAIPER